MTTSDEPEDETPDQEQAECPEVADIFRSKTESLPDDE
jgi:hypothetical protein